MCFPFHTCLWIPRFVISLFQPSAAATNQQSPYLHTLPDSILYQIAAHLSTSLRDLNSLLRTSRQLHYLLQPLLYTEAVQTRGTFNRPSILRLAAACGNLQLLGLLLLSCSRVGAINTRETKNATTALEAAILLGQIGAVNMLLAFGANVVIGPVAERRQCTLLHLAAIPRDLALAQRLLERGAEVVDTFYGGNGEWLWETTPLHLAVVRGEVAMVRILLAFGAHPDQRDMYGQSVMESAVAYGSADMVMVLSVVYGGAPAFMVAPVGARGIRDLVLRSGWY